MSTTPSEQWIARKLETAAAAIPLPPEARWIPAERARVAPTLAFALVAAAIVLAIAAYFTLPGARVVPAQQPTEPRTGDVINVGTVALDESTCSFSGRTSFAAGRIVIDVENRSSLHAHVVLLELQPSYTFAEMDKHIEFERGRIGREPRADEPLGPPTWAAIMGRVDVAPGAREQIATLVWPATHVITCRWLDLTRPLGTRVVAIADPIGPLQVVR